MVYHFSCPSCGGSNVQLSFPVWVNANDIDDMTKWDVDEGAEPEDDSDKSWCIDCESHVLLRKTERAIST